MNLIIKYEGNFRLVTEEAVVSIGQKKRKMSLAIAPDCWYPDNTLATLLFTQFGTMHMISGLLPERIITKGYSITEPIQKWINRMYESLDKKPPEFISFEHSWKWNKMTILGKLHENRVVIPFSGGKDGMFHFLISKKNGWYPHLVHVQNLNPAVCSDEKKYAERIAKKYTKKLDVIHLINSIPANGFATMRSRDMFLVSLMVPFAYKYGAKNIFIEGFGDESKFDLFSGKEVCMREFNELLNSLGLDIHIFWHNYKEWEVIKLMIEDYPKMLKETNSCFSYPLLKKKMQEEHLWPKFKGFPFFKAQCGGCLKCYIINLARIVFDNLKCKKSVIKDYVVHADKWQKRKSKTEGVHYDDPTLLYLLAEAKKKVQSFD